MKKTTPKTRKRDTSETLEQILRSGEKIFFDKSYSKATIDEIAQEANISKPTLYQYFKTKDDLYFSLMLPVIEEIGLQFDKINEKTTAEKYSSGSELIKDMFQALYKSYRKRPRSFRIFQLFHQSGMVVDLDAEIRQNLKIKGKYDFQLAREITRKAIDQGLIKKINVYEFADMIWGMFVGIIQLEDMKSRETPNRNFLPGTLNLAVNVVANAMTVESEFVPSNNRKLC